MTKPHEGAPELQVPDAEIDGNSGQALVRSLEGHLTPEECTQFVIRTELEKIALVYRSKIARCKNRRESICDMTGKLYDCFAERRSKLVRNTVDFTQFVNESSTYHWAVIAFWFNGVRLNKTEREAMRIEAESRRNYWITEAYRALVDRNGSSTLDLPSAANIESKGHDIVNAEQRIREVASIGPGSLDPPSNARFKWKIPDPLLHFADWPLAGLNDDGRNSIRRGISKVHADILESNDRGAFIPGFRAAYDVFADQFHAADRLTESVVNEQIPAMVSDCACDGYWLASWRGSCEQTIIQSTRLGSYWYGSGAQEMLTQFVHTRITVWRAQLPTHFDAGNRRIDSSEVADRKPRDETRRSPRGPQRDTEKAQLIQEVVRGSVKGGRWQDHLRLIARKDGSQGQTISVPATPREMVNEYIDEVYQKTGKRLLKKNIWQMARYKTRSEFERWEREDPRATRTARERFTRILTEKPHLK